MLARSVHLPGTRHHVEQPFVTKLTLSTNVGIYQMDLPLCSFLEEWSRGEETLQLYRAMIPPLKPVIM